jgi:hypothetical protein
MAKRLAIAALVAACSHGDPPAPAPGRVTRWHDDLQLLATTVSAGHKNAFFHVPEADWNRAVADLDARIAAFDDAHVIVGMERLIAMIGDSHTRLFLPRDRMLPVRLLWFDDGMFVGGADPETTWAIGKKVVAVGGHPIDDVIARLTPLVAYENDSGLRNELPALISDPLVLAGTDLAPADRATFTLADGAGTRELELQAGHGVTLAPPRSLPVHLQGPTQLAYWNKYIADQRLLYFQYNECINDERVGPFAELAAKTLAFADQHPVDRFVIDLRNNNGGNSAIIEPLIDKITASPALAGRVFVLIGRTTFSSAVKNAIELKVRLGATLIGSPTGGNPNGYGEVRPFVLQHSALRGQYSTKLWSDDHYRGNTVPPDIAVHVTSDDWFSGRDPAMDAVLAAPVPAR